MKIKNLHILGTSHISNKSVSEITTVIADCKPDFVAVELDRTRMMALLDREKHGVSESSGPRFSDIRKIGWVGYLFALIGGHVQKRLGNVVGVMPGSDMLIAVREGQKAGAKIALIDQHVQKTLQRLSKLFTWKERWRVVVDIFKGIFFKKREMKKYGLDTFDLSKVPSNTVILKMIDMLKVRYPSIYTAVIADRNEVMATRLARLMVRYPDKQIVAVVGAGHVSGMMELLKDKVSRMESIS